MLLVAGGVGNDVLVPQGLLNLLENKFGLDLDNAAISFSTREQGREQLAAALRGKRTLIAIDNVCEARQLDALTGLAPKGTLLFSTRLSELARSASSVSGCFPWPASSQTIPSLKTRRTSRSAQA